MEAVTHRRAWITMPFIIGAAMPNRIGHGLNIRFGQVPLPVINCIAHAKSSPLMKRIYILF